MPTTATTASTLPDYLQGLDTYTSNLNFAPVTAGQLATDPLKATIEAAPSLQKLSNIISNINQQAYMSAPGRQQQLANIQRWQAGELDPSIYQQQASQAAQLYGGGGFGVDSPAWQAAIQRGLVTNRQALQQQGAAALQSLYGNLPATNISDFVLTPSTYADVLDANRARQLQLAELRQQGALTTAQLAQARALANQELAFKQSQLQQEASLAAQQRQLQLALQQGQITSEEKIAAENLAAQQAQQQAQLAAQQQLQQGQLYAQLYQAGYKAPKPTIQYAPGTLMSEIEADTARRIAAAQQQAQQYAQSALTGYGGGYNTQGVPYWYKP